MTNDRTIARVEDVLREYSTRDYIEKDFDELKNDLDMKQIRVHTDDRMRARLLMQLKSIYRISFKGRYKDARSELSKSQQVILEALGLKDTK
jgi:transposase